VRCDVGALSALLVGGASVGELVTAGRLGGEAGDLARLGALAAAPTPWITDDF
jgi:predicted acetyltransferase